MTIKFIQFFILIGVTSLVLLSLPFFFSQKAYAAISPYTPLTNVVTTTNISNPNNGIQIDGSFATITNPNNPYVYTLSDPVTNGMPTRADIKWILFQVWGNNNNVPPYVSVNVGKKSTGKWCYSNYGVSGVAMSTFPVANGQSALMTGSTTFGSCDDPNFFKDFSYTDLTFKLSKDIDNYNWAIDYVMVAFEYTPTPVTPTLTITPTPTPIPIPEPFLDLPWNYDCKQIQDTEVIASCEKEGNKNAGKIQGFTDAALHINSYFDHEYPLQSRGLDLSEPSETKNTTINFLGPQRKNIPKEGIWYSSHDGYDYGIAAGVYNGDSVYPAASGSAEYKYDNAGGNTIYIDHHNGYQTRYYHLQDNSFYPSKPNDKKEITRKTVIGKVGDTGTHVDGPHIHIGVFYDKNYDKNGEHNFVDYEPMGATDPFGWEPYTEEDKRDPDPWEHYSFNYLGKQQSGSKSYYLWKKKIPNLKVNVDSSGGTYTVGDVAVEVGKDTFSSSTTLEMHYVPSQKESDSVWSVGPVISITAKNILGDFITVLTKPVKLIWFPFRESDLSRFKLGSFYLYSTKDPDNWIKETKVDLFTPGNITAIASHFTYFAIMGERKDIIPPTTTEKIHGEKGQENWFSTNIQLTLSATDSAELDLAGVAYTLYKIDDTDWYTYTEPLFISNEGNHTISFYSGDKDGNKEGVKTVEFGIDKTSPSVSSTADRTPDSNGWYNKPIIITFNGEDSGSGIASCTLKTYSGPDNNDIVIPGQCRDKAGNISESNYNLKYDGTPPTLTATAVSNNNQYTSGSWTNHDVQVIFTCEDIQSGVDTVTDPIMLKTEGENQSVIGSCIDNAGNKSTVTFNGINIDKTSPEATIAYDLSKFDITVIGKDNLSQVKVILTNSLLNSKYSLSDQSGNTLALNANKLTVLKQATFSINTLQYNMDPVINLDKNIFFTLVVSDLKNNVKQLDQYYSLKDDKKIFTNYSFLTNTTKINTRTPGTTNYTQETTPGIVLLQLETEKGKLKYRY